jgi:hypothetical protein
VFNAFGIMLGGLHHEIGKFQPVRGSCGAVAVSSVSGIVNRFAHAISPQLSANRCLDAAAVVREA